MMRGMREADVRAAITKRVAQAPGPTRIVDELSLCQSEARIDLAVLQPQRLVGWEIKTGADRLDRLAEQEQVYSRVFDHVWLAADVKHLAQALDLVPAWWGVMRISGQAGACRLVQIRPARVNRSVDLRSLVCLLWRDETLAELNSLDLASRGDRAPRRDLWERLASAAPCYISRTELRRRVRHRLMARTDWRVDAPRM